MIIDYKEGKQVITHSSGQVDSYDIDHIEQFKSEIARRIVWLQDNASEIDIQLDLMSTSIAINPV